MNKTTLVSSLAAAALLAGCRVYLPGETPRRTVFGSGLPQTSSPVPAAGVSAAEPAPALSGAEDDLISPQPVAAPAPVPAAAPAPVAPAPAPVPVLPPTAGPDSYRNYMPGGAGAASAPAPRPVAAPVASHAAPSAAADGGYRMYTVQPGDNAGAIANANGMTLADFAKLNGLSDPNKLRVGQTVKIATGRPAPAAPARPRPQPPQPQQTAAPAGSVVVQPGDSLSTVASRNGTTVKALMEANGLSDPDRIRAGQLLKLPGAAPTPVAAAPVAPVAPAAPAVPDAAPPVVSVPTPTTRPVAPVAAPPVVSIPTPTTRPAPTVPATTRTPVRVTADEASAAPGGTVQAGGATFDVDAALSGGGLGAARQRAQDAAQDAAGAAQDAAGAAQDAAGRSAPASGTKEYVVQENDDIYSIAMQFDSQPLRIRALNGGASLDDLKPGDRIIVPAE